MDDKSIEDVNNKLDSMSMCGERMKCGVIKTVKGSTLFWKKKIIYSEITKKVYLYELVVAVSVKGRVWTTYIKMGGRVC